LFALNPSVKLFFSSFDNLATSAFAFAYASDQGPALDPEAMPIS
jgi:hypothetical protein